MSKSADLYSQVHGILKDVPGAAHDALEKAGEESGQKGAATLRATAPKGPKNSAASWDVKKKAGTWTIYSKKPHYRVAHLLEKGHRTVGRKGKRRTKAFHYIKPVEVEMNKEFEDLFKKYLDQELKKI